MIPSEHLSEFRLEAVLRDSSSTRSTSYIRYTRELMLIRSRGTLDKIKP